MNITSKGIIAAASDAALLRREIALAAAAGVDNPQAWVEAHRHRLAAAPISAEENAQSLSEVYVYAVSEYEKKRNIAAAKLAEAQAALDELVPPGEDPLVVTDAHLQNAVGYLVKALKEQPGA